jgi:gliding motility-associated protein GldE
LETSSSPDPYPSGGLLLLSSIPGIHAPEQGVWLALLAILVLIILSGLVSASEVAFFSMSAKELDALTEKEDTQSRRLIELLNRPRYLLATILICNNLVNVGIVILSFFFLRSIIDFNMYPVAAFLLNVIGVTFFLVIFGEALPKTYATRHQMQVAYFLALPLYLARQVLWPISYLLVSSTNVIENRLRKNKNSEISIEELEHAIDLTSDNQTSKEEIGMLKGIVKFSNITVKQIMKARVDVFAVEDNISFKELVSKVKEAGYSRIPVYKETIDNIQGILYTKDLLGHLEKESFQWQQLLRPPVFVPESKKINDLLKDIQSNRSHLSIVVDEYGGMAGIITLEDILEEVIGDINDEYDDVLPEVNYKKLDAYTYIFEGKTMLKEVQKVLDIKEEIFEDIRGEADSLAGLVLEIAGKFPVKNDEFVYKNYLFKVLDISRNRIQRVKLVIKPTA